MALSIKGKSGESIATVHARYWWSGDSLRYQITKHLATGEYLHSILDDGNYRVDDFPCIGDRGIKDGSELTIVVLSSYALPSGVFLFSVKQHVAGPRGAHNIARLWVHENRSASLEWCENIDMYMTRANYLDSVGNKEGHVHFQHDGKDIEGTIEELDGKERIFGLHLPILGDVVLEQSRPHAVFDVSQTSAFVGWISLFESCEMVVKLGKKVPEGSCEAVHLRFQVWTKSDSDGSVTVNFSSAHDFENWNGEENLGVTCSSSLIATLSGPVGRRILALTDFPVIGSADLIESDLCYK